MSHGEQFRHSSLSKTLLCQLPRIKTCEAYNELEFLEVIDPLMPPSEEDLVEHPGWAFRYRDLSRGDLGTKVSEGRGPGDRPCPYTR